MERKAELSKAQHHEVVEMPVLGLGTWTLTGQTCEDAVYAALKSGYRLTDTAKYYGNEKEVGSAIARAIKDGICTREEVFVTTKLVPWSSSPEADIDDSLQKLGLSYIDLVLLHQHGSDSGDDAVYLAMIRAKKAGYIAIPGSRNPSHIAENFSVWDFQLTDSEMKELTKLNTGKRYENW